MRRSTSLSGLILVAGALALLASCSGLRAGWQGMSNRNMRNRIAPALQGTQWIHPQKAEVSPAYNGRWTLLFFFVPKSSPSTNMLPKIQALQDRYGKDRFVVIGITETDAEKTGYFLENHPVTFPVLADAREDRIAFGIKKLWEPEVYLVDGYQRIVAAGLAEVSGSLQAHFEH